MEAKDLKNVIYKMLESTDDNAVLEDIQHYIEQRKRTDWVSELGCTIEEYNNELESGDAAIQKGEYYTQEEVFSYINKQLGEYSGNKME